jgi:hypothetical protein
MAGTERKNSLFKGLKRLKILKKWLTNAHQLTEMNENEVLVLLTF